MIIGCGPSEDVRYKAAFGTSRGAERRAFRQVMEKGWVKMLGELDMVMMIRTRAAGRMSFWRFRSMRVLRCDFLSIVSFWCL
jgi:hypothetical protein